MKTIIKKCTIRDLMLCLCELGVEDLTTPVSVPIFGHDEGSTNVSVDFLGGIVEIEGTNFLDHPNIFNSEVELLEPCPKCGGPVEWSSSRDRTILSQYIGCDVCDLQFFKVETITSSRLNNLDYETTVMKYNQWAKTKPTGYLDKKWG